MHGVIDGTECMQLFSSMAHVRTDACPAGGRVVSSPARARGRCATASSFELRDLCSFGIDGSRTVSRVPQQSGARQAYALLFFFSFFLRFKHMRFFFRDNAKFYSSKASVWDTSWIMGLKRMRC